MNMYVYIASYVRELLWVVLARFGVPEMLTVIRQFHTAYRPKGTANTGYRPKGTGFSFWFSCFHLQHTT